MPCSSDLSDQAVREVGRAVPTGVPATAGRRRFLLGAGAAGLLALLPSDIATAVRAAAQGAAGRETPVRFSADWLVEEARRLATKPHRARIAHPPAEFADLTYDQYRDIRFRAEASIWRDENRRFRLDPMHGGSLFPTPVTVKLVEDGLARTVRYAPDMYDYGPLVTPPAEGADIPFSGFRARHPINNPDVWDEFVVFQGASYFRAVGKGHLYGLSARGLAIGTADPEGEEFPAFTAFWIERPEPEAPTLIVHALLESESCTGAYRFTIRPGDETVMDVETTLFARAAMERAGLAPLTSMFLFDASRRARIDDFRPAVHDSNGLEMWTGAGEHIWRPLANPTSLQISAFSDRSPLGFGLIQRDREFADYQDLEARYEKRPSAWIEPVGDWGAGSVILVEIPSEQEIHDNIVAFWRPAAPIPAGEAFRVTYRIRWCDRPQFPSRLARVVATRSGPNLDRTAIQFVVDYETPMEFAEDIRVEVGNSSGSVHNAGVQANPESGGARARFELTPEGADLVELRLVLKSGDKALSETWLYRWTA